MSNNKVARIRPAETVQGEIRPPGDKSISHRALILGAVAARQGDLFGVVSFSDRVDRFVRAGGGKAHYGACRDALYALQPRIVSPDFAEVFSFLRTSLRRRALLVFLTNLDDPILAETFAENAPLLVRQHLVLVNMIRPPGVGPVFSQPVSTARSGREEAGAGGAPAPAGLEEIYHHLAGHLQWHRLRELERHLGHRGVRFRLLDNEAFCPEIVSQYIGVKQRQLL